MMRALIVLALIAGCEKKPADAPPVDPKPAVAPPEAPSGDPVVAIDRDRIVVGKQVIPDRDGAVDKAVLDTALGGEVDSIEMRVAPDATYQRVADVMDVAVARRIETDIAIGGAPVPLEMLTAEDGGGEGILVISVSTDAIFLGQELVTRIADLPAGGDDVPALFDAIGARAEKPSLLAFQVDRRTSGEVLLRVIATTRRAGVAKIGFAVMTPGPGPR